MDDGGSAGISVLHVDDDPDFVALTAEYLEQKYERFTVETASSAEAGLDELAEREYDCVVSDQSMPGRNGIEFLRAVREDDAEIPFILFTGEGSETVASDAIAEGATDYLQKEPGTGQYELLANRITNAVEQYRTRKELARRERRLDALFEHSTDRLSIVDEDGRYRFVSPAVERQLGYSPDELVGRSSLDLVHPDDRDRVRARFEEIIENPGRVVTVEYRVRSNDGSWRWIESRERNRLDDPSIEGVVLNSRDITKRKRYEQQLEALHGAIDRLVTADNEEDIVRITVEAAKSALAFPYVIFRLRNDDDELVPVHVSEETTERLGGQRPVYEPGEPTAGLAYSKQETVVYDDVKQFDDDVDRGDVRATMYLPVGEHGVITIADDEPGGFRRSEIELAETLVRHVATAFDLVTRTRELRRQNDRLEKVIGVIGHDLRNPLHVAAGKLRLVCEDDDDRRITAAIDAVDRGLELIDELLTLARTGNDTNGTEPVRLANVVDASWRNVETADATYTVEADRVVKADASLLQELLENLIANAVEHGGDAVSITVGTFDDGFHVTDDGTGIPPDERERVFEPGYTSVERGTGMGLAIVREIVDVHDWGIRVTDAEGGGTRFEITGVQVE
ncbi:MAG: PAS domain S-box protein [Haloferacaceae archaeon]